MAKAMDIQSFITCLERARAYMNRYGFRSNSLSDHPGLSLGEAIGLTALSGREAAAWAERFSDPKKRMERFPSPPPRALTEMGDVRAESFKAHMAGVDFSRGMGIDEMIRILKERRG